MIVVPREVHVRIAYKTVHPDFYGVDMPTKDEEPSIHKEYKRDVRTY